MQLVDAGRIDLDDSHTDDILLGAILDQLHGRPFEQVLREQIFDPLGMTETGMEACGSALLDLTLLSNVDPADIHQLPYAAGLPLDPLCILFDLPAAGPTANPDEAEEAVADGAGPERELTAEQAARDIDLARRALRRIHPGYERYSSHREIDEAFRLLEESVSGGTTDAELYRDLSTAIATVRCGHTRVEAIGRTVPVDGFTDFIRPSRLDTPYEFPDSGFDLYLPYFIGFGDSFELELLDASGGGSDRTSVPAITMQQWTDLVPGTGFGNLADAVHSSDLGDGTMLLEVGTFVNYRQPIAAEALFASIFQELGAAGTEHLILDLRANGGGSDDVAWTLARFLLDQPIEFQPSLVMCRDVGDLRPYLSTWDERAFSMPDEVFRDGPDGFFELLPEAFGSASRLLPHPDRFRGRITILIGEYNASGSTMLIAKLKEAGDVRLIGRPTGGSAVGPTAGTLFFLELPGSGIKVNIPALWERNSVTTFDPGLGVAPDILIELTREEILGESDPVLERALLESR